MCVVLDALLFSKNIEIKNKKKCVGRILNATINTIVKQNLCIGY